MRGIRIAGLATATVATVLGLPAPAASAAATDLYVDNTAACSDSNPGSQAQPFCTVGAAAAVVRPGSTVHLSGIFQENVRITRSGEPGAPVTFTGAGWLLGARDDTSPAVTVGGVHDVVFRQTLLTSVLVENSDRVTLDRNRSETESADVPVIAVSGGSGTRVTRNDLQGGRGSVAVSGAADTVVSGNIVSAYGTGIAVTGSTGTVVTGNTVLDGCGPGIGLSGASTGFRLYNNIVAGHTNTLPDARATCGEGPPATPMSSST
ncbi:NosD domain-containing protein [Kitasatospora sp. NPDC085879]|uniref:right-handed parallel beta-helix repeat-containing protein n=1 Tax=Kitasatospora sp. NPDC085879 TaxID=3154769 RepID=UPI003446DB6A